MISTTSTAVPFFPGMGRMANEGVAGGTGVERRSDYFQTKCYREYSVIYQRL